MNISEFYLLLFPVSTEINKINFLDKSISILDFDSPEFKAVLLKHQNKEVRDQIDFVKQLKCEDSCFIIKEIGDNNKRWNYYHFLRLVKPSGLIPMLELENVYDKKNGKIRFLHSGGVTIWGSLHDYFINKNLLHIKKFEVIILNKLWSKYLSIHTKSHFAKLQSIYSEAVNSKVGYLKFLILMMIIESLISDSDNSGVKYKIRRVCAVLLGANIGVSQKIFENLNVLYGIRSLIVHSGKMENLKNEMVDYLSLVVSELMNTILLLQCDYTDIFDLSTKYGFGQRKLIFKEKNIRHDYRFESNVLKLMSDIKKK